VVDILSIPSFNDLEEEFEVELKMEFKWKDERLNVEGLEKKINYDPRRFDSRKGIMLYFIIYLITRLSNFWTPDPYILHQRSLFSASIMKQSEALRIYPDRSIKYGVLQNVR
jgi:hypothetical protein